MDDMLLNQNDIKLEEKKDFEDNPIDFGAMLDKRQSDEKQKRESVNPKVPQRVRAPNAAQMNDNIDSFIE